MAVFSKKTWLDRQSTYPSRRRLTSTGTADIYDVSREEGTVTQTGDAFSASNMNDLESRIEDFAEITPASYTLFDNINGTQSTITLSDSSANYYFLEIYFKNNDNAYCMSAVYEPNGKTACINTMNVEPPYVYFKSAYVAISGSTITFTASKNGNAYASNGSTVTLSSNNQISIVRVVGYK